MALSDPQSLTLPIVGAVAHPRVSSGESSGIFMEPGGLSKLTVSHATGKRVRRLVRLDIKKVSADVYLPDTNVLRTASFSLVVDHPLVGFTVADLKGFSDTLTTWLTASSGANLTKVLGGES